ncbi:MAG: glycosyl transferase [Anaerolineales bacterium]|nr:glycosyl transferase [Anaerolineales bacterium]
MRFGFFDDKNREYVITQPNTPLPWINYLGSEEYFALFSNTAGGYSFYRDARLRRLTRYRYNNVPFDRGGRYLYLRDNRSGEFWSPSWQPVMADLDDYECRHGMGYSIINSLKNGIKTSTRYFVPMGENLEIWDCTITNTTNKAVSLSLFSALEFCLWDANDDATNFQRNFNIGEVEVINSVIFHKTEYRERRDHFAYFGCSAELAGYDTQREDFLGAYRGWDKPQVVAAGKSNDSIAHGWAPIGSHHIKIDLKAEESKNVVFVLGYWENPKDDKFSSKNVINKKYVTPVIEKYLKAEEVQKAFRALQTDWDGLLTRFTTSTPNEHIDRMMNIWNAYQNMITFNLSRSASFFESGIGRGMGFRDSNQDLLGIVHLVPERARQRLLDLAATQMADGGAYHQYQPLTKRGNDGVGSNFNDDPLWLVLAACAYVKETGDVEVLDVPVQYENKEGSEKPLLDHLLRSMQYTLDRIGPNNLPLIGRADWNDCMNLNTFSSEPGESFQTTTNKDGAVAESIFIAGLFTLAAKEMAELYDHLGDAGKSTFYKDQAEKMTQQVYKTGWDGDWFLRAYDAFGDKVGSKECKEGQIFIEPQGMCIMAGMGLENGYARKALDSVGKYLATDHGIVVHQPAYTEYMLKMGEISSYPPGYKENASIFCHTNPWIIIAETLAGNPDQALDYYLRINPSSREAISEVHRCEPYIYAQTIAGKDAPTHGEAKNSWLTGTASYNYVAVSQWILGVRPKYDGLLVSPNVPADWKNFSFSRVFRGVTYSIDVERKGDGNSVSLVVDGKVVAGEVIPFPATGIKNVYVKVTLS